jgi:surface antigen/peptidoglycan hydrolase CwlO-like protein
MLHIRTNKHHTKIILIAAAILFAVSGVAVYANQAAKAETTDELRARAQALESQIQKNNEAAAALATEADSLKRKIGELDAQIGGVNAQIELTEVKLKELEIKLNEAQKELERQKELLRASVVALYKKTGASEVELLVGSDSFTSYFNEQTYLERLKAGVQESTEKVIALKQQIQAQKEEQKTLLDQQKAQKASLASAKAERQQILSDTQGKEAAYRDRTKNLVAEQRKIFEELLLRSRVVTSVGSGGYPWSSATCAATGNLNGDCWDYEWIYNGGRLDPWGYYYRNCTSYVAWRVASTGKDMYRQMGNGGQWVNSARGKGIPTGNSPRVGAAAVFSIGYYGHVAYVEEVLDGGSKIRISEYNFVQDGIYSERIMSASIPSGYVYFQ